MSETHQQFEAYRIWMAERGLAIPASIPGDFKNSFPQTRSSILSSPIDSHKNPDDLSRYRDKSAHCRSCQNWPKRKSPAWGTGTLNPKVVFITDAPTESGAWFLTDEYSLLQKILAAMKLSLSDVFITGLILCPKPFDKIASESILSCREFLMYQLRSLPDTPIVLLGEDTAANFSGISGDFLFNVGRWHQHPAFSKRPIRTIYHPRDMLHSTELKRPSWQALLEVVKLLNSVQT